MHRNFGLSMQVGGYVHGYVMDVFAAALMGEEFDNTEYQDERRPTFLRYIVQHDVSVSLMTFPDNIILNFCTSVVLGAIGRKSFSEFISSLFFVIICLFSNK